MYRKIPLLASIVTSALSGAVAGILTMAVAWALLSSGVSPVWAGAAAAALHLPVVVGSALGGWFADRYGARRVLTVSNAGSLAALGLAAGLAWSSQEFMVVLVLLLAVSNGVGTPGSIGQDARVPELARFAGVPLERANGLKDILAQIGLAGGPAVGVILVEFGGLPVTLLTAAAALALVFAVDALTFPRSRVRRVAPGDHHPGRSGLAVLAADPALATMAGLGIPIVAIFACLDEILAPSLALGYALGGDALAAFLALAGGAGMLSAGSFAAVGARFSKRGIVVASLATTALGLGALAGLPPETAFMVAPILIGLGVGPLWPVIVTAIHRGVATAERGRTIGALWSVVLLAQPMASLAAGPAVSALGAPALAILLALIATAVALLAIVLPGLHGLDRGTGVTKIAMVVP